jgi:hypothetical protein
MNKKAILFAALLGAALLAMTGCENLAHDLHKKGGGAAKTKPGSPEEPGPLPLPSGAVISLSLSGAFPAKTYGYDVSAFAIDEYVTLIVSNEGTKSSEPLASMALVKPDDFEITPVDATAAEALSAGLPAGGSVSYAIKPKNGLLPGTYEAVSVTVTGVAKSIALGDFEVEFHGFINLDSGQWEDKSGQQIAPPGGAALGNAPFVIASGVAVQVLNEASDPAYRIQAEGGASPYRTYVQLKEAKIPGTNGGSALAMKPYAELELNLAGGIANELKTIATGSAGLAVPETAVLTITGNGRLEAEGRDRGAGLGGGYGGTAGTITIAGGTVIAAGEYGAGIGGGGTFDGTGGNGGNIKISGGTVTATSLSAGIGGGDGGNGIGGNGGNIEISGGTVTARGEYSAGIGGGGGFGSGNGGTIYITGGTVTARGNQGAGIGGGGFGGAGEVITIEGGTVTASSLWSAGIGGGIGGGGGDITISGGSVTAMGTGGAGIGGGIGNDIGSTAGGGGRIIISGGTVTAVGYGRGAGIGGGGHTHSTGTGGDGGNITITGGTVYAWSTSSPAHIGFGTGASGNGASGSFSVTGKPVIFAGTIDNGGVNYTGTDGIAGNGEVAFAMTFTTEIFLGSSSRNGVETVSVTLQPGRSFTVPAGATLTIPGAPRTTLNLNSQSFTNNGRVIVKSGGILTGTPTGPGTVIRE